MGTDEAKQEMWKNKDSYIGQVATVKFQEKSKYGIPRFPKVKEVRPNE